MKKRPEKRSEEGAASAREEAEILLENIQSTTTIIADLEAEFNAAALRLQADYETLLAPWRTKLAADEKTLQRLMKSARRVLFADGDIVYLQNGNLLYAKGDRVVIPRGALAKCEEQGFADVIKVAKSLDREKIEKWPDELLVLIGAERKPTETFNYEIKKEARGIQAC